MCPPGPISGPILALNGEAQTLNGEAQTDRGLDSCPALAQTEPKFGLGLQWARTKKRTRVSFPPVAGATCQWLREANRRGSTWSSNLLFNAGDNDATHSHSLTPSSRRRHSPLQTLARVAMTKPAGSAPGRTTMRRARAPALVAVQHFGRRGLLRHRATACTWRSTSVTSQKFGM
jgi:hypothetical protein